MDYGLLPKEHHSKIPAADPKVEPYKGRKISVCEPTLRGNEKRYVLECLEKNPGCGNAIRFADMYMCNSPVRIGIVRKYKL